MAADIDIRTGLPRDFVRASAKRARVAQLEVEARKGGEVLDAFKSKAGELFIQHCTSVIEAEVAKFLDTDPKCQGLLQVLRSLGGEFKTAVYARKKLDEALTE